MKTYVCKHYRLVPSESDDTHHHELLGTTEIAAMGKSMALQRARKRRHYAPLDHPLARLSLLGA